MREILHPLARVQNDNLISLIKWFCFADWTYYHILRGFAREESLCVIGNSFRDFSPPLCAPSRAEKTTSFYRTPKKLLLRLLNNQPQNICQTLPIPQP